jgi:phosphoribosylanthranilate isomerase
VAETRVKICGVTNAHDAELAAGLGAWAVGLIFHAPSPRACDPAEATAIARLLRRRTEVMGVFVNPPLDELTEMADAIGLTMLQLHGEEGPAFCAEAARRTGCRVVKAVQIATRADIVRLGGFHTDYHLLDAHGGGLRGGTGETFDWSLVREHPGPAPVILSGGLNDGNVAEAVRAVRPFAVDVASGTEAEPGRKDPARVEAFFAAVRSAQEAPEEVAS